jgi:hypothetical protein
MDELIRNRDSRRVSSISTPLISILQEYSERLLKLEAIVAINTKREIMANRPTVSFAAEPELLPEVVLEVVLEPEVVSTPEVVPKPEELPVPVVVPEPEVVLEPEIDTTEVDRLEELIREMEGRTREINTDILALDDDLELSMDDSISVCTEDCREMVQDIKATDITPMGAWIVENEKCGSCTKQQLKAYKKAKQAADKQRAKDAKSIKEAQKRLVKEEMKALQTRLKNIKKGRDVSYGVDQIKQDALRAELRKVAEGKMSQSEFKIQMYL